MNKSYHSSEEVLPGQLFFCPLCDTKKLIPYGPYSLLKPTKVWPDVGAFDKTAGSGFLHILAVLDPDFIMLVRNPA